MSLATDILPFIPQRPPFVMIDTLEACTEHGATTSFTVRPDHIFVSEGRLNEPALIENMAQTAAAHIGYICHQQQKPVPTGFIGAVQRLKINALPQTGETLYSSISVKHQIFNATVIEGNIVVNGQQVATCEMKIFVE
ncbi:MAG: 3-hydroxyacyl-ACP dehydratase [Niabella sp.]